MLIIENRVFFTCGKIENINPHIIEDNLKEFADFSVEMDSYWFNRFDNGEVDYISFTVTKQDQENYGFSLTEDFLKKYNLEKFIIKIHKNGITSTEVYFKLLNSCIDKFDENLDEFSNENSSNLFKYVYELNKILEKLSVLKFSSVYKFGTLVESGCHSIKKYVSKKIFNVELVNEDMYLEMQNSYLLRVHRIVQNDKIYDAIQSKYKNDNTKFIECDIEIDDYKFKGTLFWAFLLWKNDEKLDRMISIFSKVLDIDTYTMNEIVIYNTAGDTYTNLMYDIDFNSNTEIKSTDLFEMYKINGYFLQKNKLAELSFSENVNNFVTSQREIEKFRMQQETFLEAEKKFHDVYNAVEANEKTSANRIVQFVLTALTLLTIVSVSKDILEFIKAEFLNEQTSTKIEFFTRSEVLMGIFGLIIFLFIVLRGIIKKI